MLSNNHSETVDFSSLEQEVGVPDWQGAIVDESVLAERDLGGDFATTYSAWFNPNHEQYAGLTHEGMTKRYLERASFVRQKHFEESGLQPFSDYMIVVLSDKPGFEIRRRIEQEVESTQLTVGQIGVLGAANS